jgi:hypothetical protein
MPSPLPASRLLCMSSLLLLSVSLTAQAADPPGAPRRARDRAEVVDVRGPATLRAGQGAMAHVELRNTGTTTWVEGYGLRVVAGSDPLARRQRARLPQGTTVPPGSSWVFSLPLRAPTHLGTYTAHFRAARRQVLFGKTARLSVQVVAAGPLVDASTLQRKLIMGYQGWFTCPGDGAPQSRWRHWFNSQTPSATSATVDCWPDTSELDADELFETGFTKPDGTPAPVFSSYKRKTVVRHFKWMQEHKLDGVALQRFSASLSQPAQRARRDQVALNVRAGAEAHGRVFYLMYDISGHDPATLVQDLKRDWAHVVDQLKLLESSRYLRHRGLPLLAIWGLGFSDRPGTAAQAAELIDYFKRSAPARYRATLMGGVPSRWRTLSVDSKTDPAWRAVYRSFDVISPWMVGRFGDEVGADLFMNSVMRSDVLEAKQAGADYMPVVFPGFSWKNLKPGAALNQTPRRGGRFYWRQVFNALDLGCTTIYGAMFDEVDEGTAMFKLAATRADLPAQGTFLPLDADGERLPSDWYLRLAGEAGKALRGEIPLSSRRPIDP